MDGAIPIKLKFFPIICNPLIEKTIRDPITNSLYGNPLLAMTWITQLNLQYDLSSYFFCPAFSRDVGPESSRHILILL